MVTWWIYYNHETKVYGCGAVGLECDARLPTRYEVVLNGRIVEEKMDRTIEQLAWVCFLTRAANSSNARPEVVKEVVRRRNVSKVLPMDC